MRNDKEYKRTEETVQVDHARRRLALRILISLTITIAIGAYIFSRVSDVLSTEAGKQGFIWGIILIGAISLLAFLMYVAMAYTPFFKVMPKGEIYRPRNWGKKKMKSVA